MNENEKYLHQLEDDNPGDFATVFNVSELDDQEYINTYGANDWVDDVSFMHKKFGFHDWLEQENSDGVKNGENPILMKQFLNFRLKFLEEELTETIEAVHNNDPEEVVDGLIDLCVVAIGTLDIFGVNAYKAWNEIDRANLSKNAGVKESRPNPLGLPDLMKPEGWKGPDHSGNHGRLTKTLE